MIDNINPRACTGCGACYTSCPKQCIQMIPDIEGFFHPIIDYENCIKCRLCDKVCHVNDISCLSRDETPQYIATSVCDKNILRRSSSGGVFSILARQILNKGGYVCGCIFTEQMDAVHVCTNSWDIVQRMQGAKYVQSNAYLVFKEIRGRLSEGKWVLFSGTPCQVAGIRRYLSKENISHLVTIDVICHGVPSKLLLKSYTECLEDKYNGKITKLEFRNKDKNGWGAEHHTCFEVTRDEKIKRIYPFLSSYFTLFFWGVAMRPSCYTCQFSTPNRVSDITLGDFWGADRSFGEFLYQGISIVGINTAAGAALFEEIRAELEYTKEQSLEKVVKGNVHLCRPVTQNAAREFVYHNLNRSTYRAIVKRVFMSKDCRLLLTVTLYRRITPLFIKKIITSIRHHGKR